MGRRRGDPELSPELREMLRTGKVAPDMSSEERNYLRSLRFRERIQVWLEKNEGSFWVDIEALEIQAGNYANCSMVTGPRWRNQKTAPGQKWVNLRDGEGWALMSPARENGGEPVVREVRDG